MEVFDNLETGRRTSKQEIVIATALTIAIVNIIIIRPCDYGWEGDILVKRGTQAKVKRRMRGSSYAWKPHAVSDSRGRQIRNEMEPRVTDSDKGTSRQREDQNTQ